MDEVIIRGFIALILFYPVFKMLKRDCEISNKMTNQLLEEEK